MYQPCMSRMNNWFKPSQNPKGLLFSKNGAFSNVSKSGWVPFCLSNVMMWTHKSVTVICLYSIEIRSQSLVQNPDYTQIIFDKGNISYSALMFCNAEMEIVEGITGRVESRTEWENKKISIADKWFP